MSINKINQLLGLAMRAGKVLTGESVLVSIQNQSAKLVLIASDAGKNTRKKLVDKATYYNIPYYIYCDSETLSQAIGKNNRMAISIIEKGFASKLIEDLRRLSDGKENE